MSALHLLRLPVKTRGFVEWALELEKAYPAPPRSGGGGRPRDADPGYALHALMAGLFGGESPRPFRPPPLGRRERRGTADPSESRLEIWGYARRPADSLRELAKLADEDLSALVDWDGVRSKPMPAAWPEGVRLRFELRACPVRRRLPKRPLTIRRGDPGPAGTVVLDDGRRHEMDAYQLAAARAAENGDPPPARGEVYAQWLADRFAADERGAPQAAALARDEARERHAVRVDSWRSVRLLRRTRGARREARWLTRPEACFSGVLRVVDSQAFSGMLAHGVGRHCGFGFGMLLLKAA